MTTWMWIFIMAIIAQRLGELYIARKNEKWMKSVGGVEKGEKHYKLFVFLHCCFFASVITEASLNTHTYIQPNYFLLLLFLLLQIGRVWCIHTLGRFWNTKIIVLPRVTVIKKGPYRYVKHPNYIIVAAELFLIPLLLGAQLTAVIFPFLHILLLKVRIPREEKALTRAT
ncbi:hypothetical protein FH966_12960 [Lentibacillus cibarius]|uniref:Isoprenylcysteine carboxyl methyltransferase n=1 Tax=Lentibacillus cibarius TaxID=2583219 RepID=A0A549YKY9_9BACI|nr:isoprenylcysteine carboxylmethyltransferase family protein [Lentibacillus cibarius]TRM12534.1 hypothetical protein FH966_12960 [Lentibacillus cibarius]